MSLFSRRDEDYSFTKLILQTRLGKTVISLGLILQNPAPSLPLSGTLVESFKDPSQQSVWIPKTSGASEPKKRGRIFSRGTLVVCNVSLVGQWISEAQSKLKDPGLVYSYHGCGRKRDPHLLASNAIVVVSCVIIFLHNDVIYVLIISMLSDYVCRSCFR